MKHSILILILATFLVGCNLKNGSSAGADNGNTDVKNNFIAESAQEMLGSFVGSFGDNKITMLITAVTADTVSGRTIVGGNDRPFEGSLKLENGVYHVTAKEPGDNKDDGVFDFTVRQGKADAVVGTWKANDPAKPRRSFSLERKQFVYRTDVGSYPEASQRVLRETDVENMVKEDLEIMRNEIFARHGYSFKKKNLRQRFEGMDWYIPNTIDVKDLLTEIEKKNVALIKRYEKYAEEFGDDYGR